MTATISQPSSSPRETSTGDLLRWLVNDLNLLVDKEVALARQEATENVRQVSAGGKVLAAGAVLLLGAYVGLIVLVTALLSLVLPLWVAALIVFAVFGVVGGVLTRMGVRRVRIRPLEATRTSLQEDVEWARHQLRPNER